MTDKSAPASFEKIVGVLGTPIESSEFKLLSEAFGQPVISFDSIETGCNEFYAHGFIVFSNKTGGFYDQIIFCLEGESADTYERLPCDVPLPFGLLRDDSIEQITKKICYAKDLLECDWQPIEGQLNGFVNRRHSPPLTCSVGFDYSSKKLDSLSLACDDFKIDPPAK